MRGREPLISHVWPLAGFDWKPEPFIGTWAGRRYVGGAMAQGATTLLLWDDIEADPVGNRDREVLVDHHVRGVAASRDRAINIDGTVGADIAFGAVLLLARQAVLTDPA